jgi:diguanylate cyclase
MTRREDHQLSAGFARQSLDRMAELAIPATPENFAVFYSYYSRRDPELARSVDQSLTADDRLDEERCRELYDKHIHPVGEAKVLEAAGARMQTSLSDVMRRISTVTENTSVYGKRLASYNGDLAKGGSAEEMRAVVRNIMEETTDVIEKNRALERQLHDSSREIMELRRHLEEVRHEASTDGLTGIANRKSFDRRMDEHIAAASGSSEPFALLLTDIDHFKRFNDTFGHRVGDEVLRVVARVLKAGVRQDVDTPARYGGEEFAIILDGVDLEAARERAERLRRAVASKNLKSAKTQQSYGTITLSIGIAMFRPGDTAGAMVRRADAALYAAKGAGRNRVCVEGEADDPLKLAS